jgi:hypothetical protein
VIVLTLAAGLFVPQEHWPKWLADHFPKSPVLVPPNSIPPNSEETAPPVAEVSGPRADAESATADAASPPPSVETANAPSPAPPVNRAAQKLRPDTPAELMNAYFTPLPKHPSDPPRVVDVPVPRFPGSDAVWGGTGRDVQGRVWFGACVAAAEEASARVFCYDTQTGEMADAGDVVSALRTHGLLRAGESQMKIHSKIIQAGDGHLYFASMDERGEAPDGSRPPTWGGHLWRLRLPDRTWDHLHATPEALIAVAGMGRFLYALGYFGHVVVQFDTETGALKTTTVGSVDGHVSRNLLADLRGHAYVPRVRRNSETKQIEATLVELDADLNEVAQTPLEGYCDAQPAESHGITGVQPMADGSIVFLTHRGRLFHVVPHESGPAEVKDLGWMHPLGEMPIESLFTYDGRTWVMAAVRLPAGNYEWVSFDLKSTASTARTLDVPVRYAGASGLLLYGSTTRDVEGAFYLVGASGHGPLVWRLMPPP